MTKMVRDSNNGVVALVSAEDYEILKKTCTPDEAYAKGVRWFVFISMERALKTPELAGKVTATYEELSGFTGAVTAIEKGIYVPLSNGPLNWDDEAKFVLPYSAFLKHVALASR